MASPLFHRWRLDTLRARFERKAERIKQAMILRGALDPLTATLYHSIVRTALGNAFNPKSKIQNRKSKMTTGTCQKCGCTQERACRDGCAWIDAQRDLCSRCAEELLLSPLDNLSDALLAVRALRATHLALVEHVIALTQKVAELESLARFAAAAANGAEDCGRIAIEVPGQIWTPE